MLFQSSQTDYTELLECQLQSRAGQPVQLSQLTWWATTYTPSWFFSNELTVHLSYTNTHLSVLTAFAVLSCSLSYPYCYHDFIYIIYMHYFHHIHCKSVRKKKLSLGSVKCTILTQYQPQRNPTFIKNYPQNSSKIFPNIIITENTPNYFIKNIPCLIVAFFFGRQSLIATLILAYGADCSISKLPTSLNKQIAEIKV